MIGEFWWVGEFFFSTVAFIKIIKNPSVFRDFSIFLPPKNHGLSHDYPISMIQVISGGLDGALRAWRLTLASVARQTIGCSPEGWSPIRMGCLPPINWVNWCRISQPSTVEYLLISWVVCIYYKCNVHVHTYTYTYTYTHIQYNIYIYVYVMYVTYIYILIYAYYYIYCEWLWQIPPWHPWSEAPNIWIDPMLDNIY